MKRVMDDGRAVSRLAKGAARWVECYFGARLGYRQPVQGSHLGVAFRVVDAQTHDAVYFRPFNVRAADAVRHSHALQYVSHPRWPWQTLRSEHPHTYERAVVPEPDVDEWFHVRVVVERPKVSVFINGKRALPGCPGIVRQCSRISWLVGRSALAVTSSTFA